MTKPIGLTATNLGDPEAEPHFSQPVRQIMSMLIVLGLVGALLYIGFGSIAAIFLSNPYLNGLILGVFVLGVLSCFNQVGQLMRSVRWIEGFARAGAGHTLVQAPSLLAPLATLLRSRGQRMQLSATSSRSILDSVAQRIDEDREITRYIGNTLIFLGLLGTFYGLAVTVPALLDTIRSLNPAEGETGADIFARLQTGLERQLGGMGTAFSSSLLGLAGSLVVGLLELFAGHGQNRFYRELEEWLSSITRVSFAGADEAGGETGAIAEMVTYLADQMQELQTLFRASDESRGRIDAQLGELAEAVGRVAARMEADESARALARVAEGQERVIGGLDRLAAREAGEGVDAESRMRLRSIDVQLLRLLEEISAGRQETMAELRADLAALAQAIRSTRG